MASRNCGFFSVPAHGLKSLDTILTNQRPQGGTQRRPFVLGANAIYICGTRVLIGTRPCSVVKPARVQQNRLYIKRSIINFHSRKSPDLPCSSRCSDTLYFAPHQFALQHAPDSNDDR